VESEQIEVLYRFPSKLIRNQGTWYLHVPKDYAGIMGLQKGWVAEVAITKLYKTLEERKK
jgi:hypothetical protein